MELRKHRKVPGHIGRQANVARLIMQKMAAGRPGGGGSGSMEPWRFHSVSSGLKLPEADACGSAVEAPVSAVEMR